MEFFRIKEQEMLAFGGQDAVIAFLVAGGTAEQVRAGADSMLLYTGPNPFAVYSANYDPTTDPNNPLFMRAGIVPVAGLEGIYFVDNSPLSRNYGIVYDRYGRPLSSNSDTSLAGFGDWEDVLATSNIAVGALDNNGIPWSPRALYIVRGANGALTIVGGGITAYELNERGHSTGASVVGGAASAGGGLLAGGGGALAGSGACIALSAGTCTPFVVGGGITGGIIYVATGANDAVGDTAADLYDNPPPPAPPVRRDFRIPTCGIGVSGFCLPPVLNGETPSETEGP